MYEEHVYDRRCEFWAQQQYTPPLTSNVAPVMKPSYSLARNATARATSWGLPARPNGMPAIVAAADSGVV